MSNPDTQVNETPEAQPLNQEQQNTIKDINTLLANNNKEISTINDLLNKDFLKWISAELAWQILQNIPDQLQNDPNIKKVIIVLSAKTSVSDISWNNSNLQNYSNNIWRNLNNIWNIDIWSFTIDLSNYKKDISGNSESYWLTGLTWELQQCLNLIGSSENLQNLKNNLEGIKKIIEGKSTNLNDLNKIEQFLNDNQINLEPWNENDISPLLQWIHKFILNIAPTLSHNKSNQEQANRILEEEEQKTIERNTKLTEMSTAFSDIENKIPNDLWNLSKLNKKDIQNIKDFITESKSNNTISTHTNAKESVFLLYLKMYRCQQALNSNGITHRDKNNFNEIFNHITNTFKNNEIQNYELWLQFKWINETNLKSAAPQNWDWKYLTEENNNSFLQTVCRWHLFQPKDYMDKFNNINGNRVNNIVSQLQNYKISDFLQYFELNDNKDGLIPKNDKEHFNSLNENDRTTALRGILTKQVASTVKNLVNWENEIKWIIWEYNSKENTNILTDWTKKIIEELNKQQNTPEWWNWNQETEMTFENLPVLDTNSIKKVFSNLNKQDIVKFFNEQKARTDLTGPQKTQLLLLYKGLTERFVNEDDNVNRWKENIKTLQHHLKENDANLAIDWKFGIQTFNTLLKTFWKEPIKIDTSENYTTIDQWIKTNLTLFSSKTINNQQIDDIKMRSKLRLNSDIVLYEREGYSWCYYKQENEIIYIPTPPLYYTQKLSKFPTNKNKESRTANDPTNCEYFKQWLNTAFMDAMKELGLDSSYSQNVIEYQNNKFRLTTHGHSISLELSTLTNWWIRKKADFKNNLKDSLKENFKLLNLVNYLKSAQVKWPFSFDNSGKTLQSNNRAIDNVFQFDNGGYKTLNTTQQSTFIKYLNETIK